MTYKRPRFTQRHRWFAWALAPKVWCALTLGNVLSESEPSAGIPHPENTDYPEMPCVGRHARCLWNRRLRLDGHHGIDGAARNDHGLSAGAHGVHRDRLRCNSAQRIRLVPTLSRCCIVVIVTAIALAGCFTAVAQEPPGVVRQLVPSLAGDGVDRQAVTSALGRPWRSFEGGRICVYRIVRTTDGVSVATRDADDATHELVLTFDDQGVVQRYSLLRLR